VTQNIKNTKKNTEKCTYFIVTHFLRFPRTWSFSPWSYWSLNHQNLRMDTVVSD